MAITGPVTDKTKGRPVYVWTITGGGSSIGDWATWPGGTVPAFFGPNAGANFDSGSLIWQASPAPDGPAPFNHVGTIGDSSTSTGGSTDGMKSAFPGRGSVRPVFSGGTGSESMTVILY